MANHENHIIYVTTFYNPDLFWFLYEKDIPDRNNLTLKLQNLEAKVYKNYVNGSIGDKVLVNYSNEWLRAEIVDIKDEKTHDEYECWLLDYGIFVNVKKVYKIPENFLLVPQFVHKARLFGLKSIFKEFDFTVNKLIEKETDAWVISVRDNILESLKRPNVTQYFEKKFKLNDISIGILKIQFKGDDKIFDIADQIIGLGHAKYDEQQFLKDIFSEKYIKSLTEVYKLVRSVSDKLQGIKKDEKLLPEKEIICVGRAKLRVKDTSNNNNDKKFIFNQPISCYENVEVDEEASGEYKQEPIQETSTFESDKICKGRGKLLQKFRQKQNFGSTSLKSEYGDSSDTKSESSNCEKTTKKSAGRGFLINNISKIEDENMIKTKKSKGRGIIKSITSKSVDLKKEFESCSVDEEKFENAVEISPNKSFFQRNKIIDVLDARPGGFQIVSYSKNSASDRSVMSLESESSSNHTKPNFRGVTYKKRPPNNTDKQSKCSDSSSSLSNRIAKFLEKPITSNNFEELPSTNVKNCPEKYEDEESFDENYYKITGPPGKCDCENCTSCMDNSMIFKKFEAKPLVIPKEIEFKPPAPLFKSNNEPTDCIFKSNMQLQSNVKKLLDPRVLVHGKYIIHPITDLCSLSINEHIHKILQNFGFQKPLRTQVYTWPAIIRGQHLFLVNAKESGKTMSHLPVLCSFVMYEVPDLPTGIGPIAIVVCPSVKIAENIYNITKYMLNTKDQKVVLAVPPFGKSIRFDLTKGVDILVCTPKSLINMLDNKLITLKRLLHLVLESSNEILEYFPKEMEFLFMRLQKVLLNRTFGQSIQLISISEQWSPALEMLAKRLYCVPMICIGAYLEAALYGRVNIQIHRLSSTEKSIKLIEILKEIFKFHKTIIICNAINEVEGSIPYLETNGIDYEIISETSNSDYKRSVLSRWNNAINGYYFVLITTDETLNLDATITDASMVIQYSLPNTSWSQFAFRFSSFMDNYRSPLQKEKKDYFRCKMHIFIDETNLEQYTKIALFLKRMGCQLSETMLEIYENLIKQSELIKLDRGVELCSSLLSFGDCSLQRPYCKSRHILSKNIDITSYLPQSGLINFKVLYVSNPNTYYCRLLEHTDSENNKHKLNDLYGLLAIQLADAMLDLKGKEILEIHVGHTYALMESMGIFKRCIVETIVKVGALKRPIKAAVKLIDFGVVKTVKTNDLFLLPDNLKEIPPQAVPIILANIGPLDKDNNWSKVCSNIIRSEFAKHGFEDSKCYFTGRIMLQLENRLFVNNLILQESLENGSLLVNRLNLKNMLLKRGIMENRPEMLKNLYTLCEEHNIELPNYNLPKPENNTVIQPQKEPNWAHLENGKEFNEVYFSAANSPDLFFVKLFKNDSSLKALRKDIEVAMKRPFYPTKFTILQGRCYLVKDPLEETYERVILKKFLDDEKVECFFVDYGDFIVVHVSELRYLSDDLITQLPFQAIECKLYGIKPINNEWPSVTTDILYDVSKEPDTEFLRFLYVKVMGFEKPTETGYKKYSVILIDNFESNTIINTVYLKLNYAMEEENACFDVDFEKLRNIFQKINENKCDSDEDEDEKEISNFIYEENADELDDDPESDKWDLQIFDTKIFFAEMLKITEDKKSSTPNTTNRKLTQNDSTVNNIQGNEIKSPGFSTPNIIWQQNDAEILLRIQITGVTVYELMIIRKRTLFFQTKVKDTLYKLQVNLFDKVDKNTYHHAHGLHVLVKLKKDNPVEWPRLISNINKMRNISYNVNAIKLEDDSDDEDTFPPEKFKIYKENVNLLNDDDDENGSFIYEFGSDDECSESDIDSLDSSNEMT